MRCINKLANFGQSDGTHNMNPSIKNGNSLDEYFKFEFISVVAMLLTCTMLV